MKIFIVSTSLKQASLNHKLATHIASVVESQGNEADLARMTDFDTPMYNFDDQQSTGIPANVEAFRDRLEAADGWIITSPEFNWSVPANIKNMIDWLSRMQPMPLAGKTAFLTSASPSLVGGVRGLLHFRQSLEALGTWTYPKLFALAQAPQAFDDNGALVNEDISKMLNGMLTDYCSGAAALKNR